MFSKITISFILFSLSAILGLIGTLLIRHGDKHTVNTITETPGDVIGPLLLKDYIIDPRLIYKRRFYDPHNRKMKRVIILGIVLLVVGVILLIAGLLF